MTKLPSVTQSTISGASRKKWLHHKNQQKVTHLIQNQKKKLEEAYSLQIYWLMKKQPLRNWKSTIAFQIAFIATDEHLFVTNLAQNWPQKVKA